MKISFLFKQMINIPAILQLPKLLYSPSYCIPYLQLKSLNDINLNSLHHQNIKYIVFDKDNTLTLPYKNDIHYSIQKTIEVLKLSYGNNIAILSNSVGSCDDLHFQGKVLYEIIRVKQIH